MIRNYLKTAWRNLRQNKVYSLLNILGLATGMTVALLIGLWIHYQFSYNRFLQDHDHVYKVGKQYMDNGTKRVVMASPQALADVLRKDVPGIQFVARTDWMKSHGLSVGDKKIFLPGGMVDKDFLNIFQYPLIEGNAAGALQEPHSIVLSKATAFALFGSESAIHKTVRIDNEQDLKVTAIIEDVPANSTMQFNFLVPLEYYIQTTEGLKANENNWDNYTFQTFVSLRPDVSPEKIQPSLSTVIARYNPQEYKDQKSQVTLQAMDDWHLYSDYRNGVATGLIEYVIMFGIIGMIVLLIACINFVNLSTARSQKRAKEVGIRKTIGSLRGQLIIQFLMESVLMVFIAFCIALIMVQLTLPSFSRLTSSPLAIPYTSKLFWACMVGYVLVTGLIAGSRPAFYLSSFRPVKVLKGAFRSQSSISRKVLVVLQFTCSIVLMISTMVIYRQIQYARERPAGYDINGLVMTDGSADTKRNFPALKNELLQSGAVTAVTQSSSPVTGNTNYNAILQWPGQEPGESINIATVGVADADYFSTMGMELQAGRNFKADTDSLNVIVNESAVAAMNLEDPLNKTIRWGGNDNPVRIIGVVKDALIGSPFYKPEASIFFYAPDLGRVITYRLNPQMSAQQSITSLSGIFNKYNPAFPYEYKFVDQVYAAKFKLALLIGKLAGVFAGLAIFISCLGLFGLAAYMAEQRTKEIGVRKILGASVFQIGMMLSKDFIILVLISAVIGSPVALYFLRNWLQQYDYRISMGVGVFLLSSSAALVITLITISLQAIRAATANPVKSLRTE